MRLVVAPDADALARIAANLLWTHLFENPGAKWLLAAGRTPAGLYARLAADGPRIAPDLTGLRLFDLDEYAGRGPGDPGSFAASFHQGLLRGAPFSGATIDLFDGSGDLEGQCARRESALRDLGGPDLAVLGLGEDGHVAFNAPGTPFGSRTRVVELNEAMRAAASRGGSAPERGVTVGLATILDAKRILLLASGESKATALAAALEGPVDESVPASVLQLHPDVVVVADREAASRLRREPRAREDRPDLRVFAEKDLPEDARLVVVSPHPDDASISCGGLMSLVGPRRQVTVLGFTTGHRAHIEGTTSPRERIRIRRRELEEECRILGAELRRLELGFYDDAYAFHSGDVERVATALLELEPHWILTPSPRDRHPAHRASTHLALEAVRRLFESGRRAEPVEIWHYEGPWYLFHPGEVNAVVQLPPRAVAMKRAAIAQHVSQMHRHRYDEAAVALARFRAVTLPEVRLAGFGQAGVDLGEAVEAYRRIVISPR